MINRIEIMEFVRSEIKKNFTKVIFRWRKMSFYIISVLLLSLNIHSLIAQETKKIKQRDIVLINEAFAVQEKLGYKVWEGWMPKKVPFLFKKGDYEYLIFHENPPEDYKLYSKTFYNYPMYWKKRKDTLDFEATFDINGIPTVVMTAPSADEDIRVWIFQANHEMFHVFQSNNYMTNQLAEILKIHPTTKESDALAAFNHKTASATLRLESDRIYSALIKDTLEKSEKTLLIKRFSDIKVLQDTLVKDRSILKYKITTEWTEGVARYVETKLARLVIDDKAHDFSPNFKAYFPKVNFQELPSRYSRRKVINPIRFVGGGVKGRLMFYYLGMGKALLLDKIYPNWKTEYFSKTLDELLLSKQ